ncbi:MAG: prolyl oligopeptidase family serine peptidase [Myxococcales bacterium]|nr:prolyl oligopeptidase family serine peptidase [Myxococcales bacterium]
MRVAWIPIACWLLACAPAANVAQPAASGAATAVASERDALDRLNERMREGAVAEQLHGMEVADPYRALERDDDATQAWIEAQTAHTGRSLAPYRDARVEARLRELLSIGTLGAPQVAGGRIFLTRREGEREQPALYVVEEGRMGETPLVDPTTFGERASLDWFYASPDGEHVAFGIADKGDERAVLHVVRVDDGVVSPLRIHHAKWSGVSWLNDGSGFYYTRYPAPGEPGHDAEQEDTYFSRVFFHRLGDDPVDDARIFGSDLKTDVPFAAVGSDDRYVVLMNFRGWTATDVFLLDRGRKPAERVVAPDAEHPLVTIQQGVDARTSGVVHRGTLYLLTNDGAPRRRLLAVAPERAGDPRARRELILEARGTVEDWALTRDGIALHYVENMGSRVALFDLEGESRGDLELPSRGSIGSLAGDRRGDQLAFVFSSFFYPPALIGAHGGTGASSQLYQVRHDLELGDFALSEQWVRSRDGTRVHLFYVHRRDVKRDAGNAVLLTGYGGFDVSLLPQFTRTALHFIERGGVYAIANLRGGGELGEAWHRAGMKEHKPRVFEDMEAVLRWLSKSRISRPSRIAITGGSNGGLLVGAMLTRAPETFGAAVGYVGLYDMLRYHHFPPAAIWASEYGDPEIAEEARYLHAYSPYHRVTPGTVYPATLIETADHDTRVYWGHSTKFAARLQQAQGGRAPIYFHMTRKQGHGRGTRLSDLVEKYARQGAFLREAIGAVERE